MSELWLTASHSLKALQQRLLSLGASFYFAFFLFLPSSVVADVYTGFFGSKAVGGYDSVAYFTQGKAVKGDKKFRYRYQEADWYFSSQSNLESFKQEPQRYAPQYGGYCAWAVGANAARAPGDPKQWRIVDDKLYLNFNKKVHALWSNDIPGFIATGNSNWDMMNSRP